MPTKKQNKKPFKPEKWYWVVVSDIGIVLTASFAETEERARTAGAAIAGVTVKELAKRGYYLQKVSLLPAIR